MGIYPPQGCGGGGGASKQLLNAGDHNNTHNPSMTYFHPLNTKGNYNPNVNENQVEAIMPFACKIKNLRARTSFFNINANVTLTLRKNGADTALTVTFVQGEGSDVLHNDLVNEVSFAAGDSACWKVACGGSMGSLSRLTINAELIPL